MGPVHLLRIVIPLCAAATFLLSFRLWTTDRGYPHVPMVPGMPQPPEALALVLFVLMLLALLVTAASGKFVRAAMAIALAILFVWVALDQNRWQPYVVFYAVAFLGLLLHTHERGVDAAFAPFKTLLCFTYFYSGLHKFNYRYVTHDFEAFLSPLFARTGIELTARAMAAGSLLAAAFEMSMGVLLFFARTRRLAVIGLTLMHAFILLALGPFGANYNSVVWPWNVASIAALWLVFARDDQNGTRWFDGARRPARLAFFAVVVLFGVMPLASFAGRWVSALSFRLYSGKQPAATLAVTRRSRLPVVAAQVTDSNNRLDLFAWAMREMNVSPSMEKDAVLDVATQLCRETGDQGLKLAWAEAPELLKPGRWVHHYTFEGPECRPVEVTRTRD